MTIKFAESVGIVREREFHCDGPNHKGDRYMQCDPLTLEHGYGSPFDGDTHHFCSLKCLQGWVTKVNSARRASD